MIPVRTNASNLIYKGDPATGVEDAWVERTMNGVVGLTWKPSDEEREAIAAGGLVQLVVFGEPIPPTMVLVSRRVELSAIGARLRDRALAFHQAPVTHDELTSAMRSEFERGVKHARDESKALDGIRRDALSEMQERVQTFEAASGIAIDRWSAGRIGEAVKVVMESGGRGGHLAGRLWMTFCDALDSCVSLAHAVNDLGGPGESNPYSRPGGATSELRREVYARLAALDREAGL